jgi:hypothetical protein
MRRSEREYLLLTDSRHFLCALDVESDHVMSVFDYELRYPEFFNSDLGAFTFFIGMLEKDVLSPDQATEQIVEALDRVEAALQARDPAAMEVGEKGLGGLAA